MDWMEKAKKETEERQMKERSIKANAALITESGLLEKIEKERVGAQKGTQYVFNLHPYHIEGVSDVSVDPNRFARGGAKYTVQCQYETFSIIATEDGIYFELNSEWKQKIDPKKITSKEVHEWFGFIVERPSFLKRLFRALSVHFRK